MKITLHPTLSMAAAALLIAGFATAGGPAVAASMSAVEKLYADLAKLSPEDRQKRIIEGTKKEAVLVFNSTRGKLGRTHRKFFRKRYPFIKLDHLDVGGQDAADRFRAEETAGRHLTDSLEAGVPDVGPLIKRGLIARYPTPATKNILPAYKGFLHPEDRWVAWQWNEHGVAYNANLVKPADVPKSYQDLCDPKHKGNVSFEPAENDFLVGMYHVFDKDEAKLTAWFKCIGANKPVIQRGHTTRLNLMLAGDHAISGENYLYKGYTLAKKNPKKAPFKIAYSAGILAWPRVTVISKNAPHPHAAALHADWNLSKEAQEDWSRLNRGTTTLPHPFFPVNTKIVTFLGIDEAIMKRLADNWKKYVGASKY